MLPCLVCPHVHLSSTAAQSPPCAGSDLYYRAVDNFYSMGVLDVQGGGENPMVPPSK